MLYLHFNVDRPGEWTLLSPSLNVVLMRPHVGARRLTTRRTVACILVLEVGDPDPQPEKKGEKSHG